MTQVTQQTSIIPSNPKDQEAIFDAIKDADVHLQTIANERDQIKDIIDEIHEKYEINKGLIRKMINTYHKQNFAKVEQETEDFFEAYEKIVKM
jgi:hypothetical protein